MERRAKAVIGSSEAGDLLLDWLSRRFTYLSRAEWAARLVEGRISVDGEVSGGSRPLLRGESVAFAYPPFEEPPVDADWALLFERDGILVVRKPPLLPCHPGGRFFRNTLLSLLRERYPEASIATRLDRETSGLLLAAAEAGAARHLAGLLEARAVRKGYLALVHGDFPDRLEAKGWLLPDEASPVRKKRRFQASAPPAGSLGGETCETLFTALRREGGFSLVRAQPAGGRTHQIRASLFSLGFPLVGDKLYGLDDAFFIRHAESRLDEEDRRRLILPHQALHCESLEFADRGGRSLSLACPPPWELAGRPRLVEPRAQPSP